MDRRSANPADLVVRNANVHTLDPALPRARAFAIRDGRIVAVGADADVDDLIGTDTHVVDAAGELVMPGLVDVHSHVGFGGQQSAWELTLPPGADLPQILRAVADRADQIGPDDWVVGGTVISPVFQAIGTREALAALDEAAGGRPVLLRDDSLHNRWVNSRALEIMGVDDATADRGYVRDADGMLVGQLLEAPSTAAELAVRRSVPDVHARDLTSARTAISIFNSVGVTATQDAATMGAWPGRELLDVLDAAVSRGLHAKLHATADGTVRQALDAVATMRERHGPGAVFHIAHPEFVDTDDVARFRELDVVADLSPVLWFPNPMNDIIAMQVQDHYLDRIWPLRELQDAGALLAAGSDWPVAMATPNPWLSIETMVTRRNPDTAAPGVLGAEQAIDLADAIRAHTVNPARAIGLGEEISRIKAGFSADFIILDRDIFEVPVIRIHATRVRQTWFAGRRVYDVDQDS
ncbi:MAG TPA: amidohydrolase family protein [Pseudonocardiaceae bacterium]|jgi:predicted amidohydrolase YtcJ|nr:amidohydrolase family protein [Pseudonocardiaceae bacterium]